MDRDGHGWLDLVLLNYVVFGPDQPQYCESMAGVRSGCPPNRYRPEFAELWWNTGRCPHSWVGAMYRMRADESRRNSSLFFCLQLSDSTRARLSEAIAPRRRCSSRSVKWTRPQNLHLTVRFLGATPENKLAEVATAALQTAALTKSFDLAVTGIGAFPDWKHPRALWAGVTAGSGELSDLHARLEVNLETCGFERERKRFHPHVTLGRVRDARPLDAVMETLRASAHRDFGTTRMTELVLIRSELQATGAVYRPLERFPFVGYTKATPIYGATK